MMNKNYLDHKLTLKIRYYGVNHLKFLIALLKDYTA